MYTAYKTFDSRLVILINLGSWIEVYMWTSQLWVTFWVKHFIFLSNDLESHKKEAYINPIGFIRELKQSQTIQAIFERAKHYYSGRAWWTLFGRIFGRRCMIIYLYFISTNEIIWLEPIYLHSGAEETNTWVK